MLEPDRKTNKPSKPPEDLSLCLSLRLLNHPAMHDVPEHLREDCLAFVQKGAHSDELKPLIDDSPKVSKAVETLFLERVSAVSNAIKILKS